MNYGQPVEIPPLWLAPYDSRSIKFNLEEVIDQRKFRVDRGCVTINLKTGVEYDAVLDDVVRQLREIGEAVRNATRSA